MNLLSLAKSKINQFSAIRRITKSLLLICLINVQLKFKKVVIFSYFNLQILLPSGRYNSFTQSASYLLLIADKMQIIIGTTDR